MIYFTGDVHGSSYDLINRFSNIELTPDDVIVILGDAGFNYFGNRKDLANKMHIKNEICATVFCVHGNHERRPETISTYITREFLGGTVYFEPEFPNLVFAVDGERYLFDVYTALVMGGAYSVDKYYRLKSGHHWFSDEQISEEKRLQILDSIRANPTVDLVLTHTCPYEWQPTDLFLPSVDQSAVDNTMEHFFSECEQILNYKCWLFGHFHDSRRINDKAYMCFRSVLPLPLLFYARNKKSSSG